MRFTLALLAMLLAACTDNAVDTAPDAATTVDAATCGFTLPRCVERDPACATGMTPVDCPHSEDTSVCYCPSATNPGWCFNR